MDYERLYAYRFKDVDQASRVRVWQVLARYLYERMGRPQVVLDPAAGRGEFINAVPARERWALDMADTRAYMAKEVRFSVQDATRADVPGNHFDAVLVSNFLEHLPHPDAIHEFLVRMRRALKDSGRLAIMGPNFRYCAGEYFDCADHVLPLTHVSVAEHLYAAGYTPRTVIPRFLPYSLRSRLPSHPLLVRAYLRLPLAWPVLGKQFLLIAEKDRSAA